MKLDGFPLAALLVQVLEAGEVPPRRRGRARPCVPWAALLACPLQQRHGFDDRIHAGARLLRRILCERGARLLEHERVRRLIRAVGQHLQNLVGQFVSD